ncbi:MAG: endonuclease III [Planctomycetia bacterium]|nr:endonuclease III [Planctomycetia bacterium]
METQSQKSARAAKIFRLLQKAYPRARCTLDYDNPLELLVATILAAQCTDERVNVVTQQLFKQYRGARAFADADVAHLEKEIRSTGFFRQKAKNIKAMCRALCAEHKGHVPADIDALTALPGTGRKTANVVLGNAFGIPGMVVDTHVKRLSGRLGLSKEKTPEKIEAELVAIVPEKNWTQWSHLLLAHGRAVCRAKKPDCAGCLVNHLCPSAFKV